MVNKIPKKISLFVFLVSLLFSLMLISSAYALPQVSLSVSTGVVGTNVTIFGTGFNETDTISFVYFGSTLFDIVDVPVNSTGNFNSTISFIVPLKSMANYTVSVTGLCYYNSTSFCYTSSNGSNVIYSSSNFSINPKVNLSTASGYVGDIITVYGYGFASVEKYLNVSFGGNVIYNFTATGVTSAINEGNLSYDTLNATSDGLFSVNIIIPESASDVANTNVTVSGDNSTGITFEFTVLPKIVLNVSSPSPNDVIEIIGTGFKSLESEINLTFGDLAYSLLNPALVFIYDDSISANVNGTFNYNFTVPYVALNIPAVSRTLNITTSQSNLTSKVLSIVPKILINSTTGILGESLSINGYGFIYGDVVSNAKFNSVVPTYLVEKAIVLANGSFEAPIVFKLPFGYASSSYPVSVSGVSTGLVVTRSDEGFIVSPQLNVSSDSAYVGDSVYVFGYGFNVSESLNVTFNGNVVIPTGVIGSGLFSNASNYFVVPPLSGGVYTVDVSRNENMTTVVALSNITILPKLILNQSSAAVGQTILVNGTGFVADEIVNVTIGGILRGSSNILVGIDGTFSSEVDVGDKPSGVNYYYVDAVGNVTAFSSVSDVLFIYSNVSETAKIELSAASGYVGDIVTVYGSNFAANDGGNSIRYNKSTSYFLDDTFVTDSNGAFSINVTIPHIQSSSSFIGTTSTSTSFILSPNLILYNSSGNIGDTVNVFGTGFVPGETVSSIYFGGPSISSSTTVVGSNGDFVSNITFTIPSDKNQGSYTVQVVGTNTTASAQLTIDPKVVISSSIGIVGDIVLVTGTGFNSGQSGNLVVYFDGVSVSAGNSISNGNFNVNITIPNSTNGQRRISANDGSTGQIYSDVNFTVNPAINVTVITTAGVGDVVVLTGTGFKDGAILQNTIAINGVRGIHKIVIPSTGYFSGLNYTIPSVSGKSGGYSVITVQDLSASFVNDTFNLVPSLKLSLNSGHFGDTIILSGTGFVSGESIDTFKFDTLPLVGSPISTTVKSDGTFMSNISIIVPDHLAGLVQLSVNGNLSGTISTYGNDGFNISPFITGFTSRSGGPGYKIKFTGHGFNQSSGSVLANTTLLNTTNCTHVPWTIYSDGNFSVDDGFKFEIPNLGDESYGVKDMTVFGVVFSDAFFYSTSTNLADLVLNATSVNVGDVVLVYGTGFNDSYGGYYIDFDGVNLTTVTNDPIPSDLLVGNVIESTDKISSSNGAFKVLFTVPEISSGTYIVDTDEADSETLTVNPKILLNVTETNVGDTIFVTGTGFTSNESVNVIFDGTVVASVNATNLGSFSASFNVVEMPENSYNIDTVGTSNPTPVSIAIKPKISASVQSGTYGTNIIINGTGFKDALISSSNITIGGVSGTHWAVMPVNGSFTDLSFTVPELSGGASSFSVQGYSLDTNFYLEDSLIYVNPSFGTGAASRVVIINGSYFSPGQILANTITIGGSATTHAAITVASDGTFAPVSVTITETLSEGSKSITIQEKTFIDSYTVVATLSLTPILGYGASGQIITLSGTGFSDQTIGANTITVSGSATTHSAFEIVNGAFTSKQIIVSSTLIEGVKSITVNGKTFTNVFTVKPIITISPESGIVANSITVTVSGTGFSASETYANITFDDVFQKTVSINSLGQIYGANTFVIPTSCSGAKTIKIERTSNLNEPISTFTCTVVTTPPAESPVSTTATTTNTDSCTSNTDCSSTKACVNSVCTSVSCDVAKEFVSLHKCLPHTYSFDLVDKSNPQIVVGESKSFDLKLKNAGTYSVKNLKVAFSSSDFGENISNWYSISPNLISYLGKDQIATYSVKITVPNNTGIKDIPINVKISSEQFNTTDSIVISVLPDNASTTVLINGISGIETNISLIQDVLESLIGKINDSEYQVLNVTLGDINTLFKDLKSAVNVGDYKSAYDKKNQIEQLITKLDSDIGFVHNGLVDVGLDTFKTIFVLFLIIIMLGVFLYMWLPPKEETGFDNNKGYMMPGKSALYLAYKNYVESKTDTVKSGHEHSYNTVVAHGAVAHGAVAHGAVAHGAVAHGAVAHGAVAHHKAVAPKIHTNNSFSYEYRNKQTKFIIGFKHDVKEFFKKLKDVFKSKSSKSVGTNQKTLEKYTV
ncbi:MAG: hypothetical protein K0B02_02465 [DPANN group archaeon]|nr:hypothetical protein [DPANN group archaeon]